MTEDYQGEEDPEILLHTTDLLYWYEWHRDLYQIQVLTHCDEIANNIISQDIDNMLVQVEGNSYST